MFFDFHVHGDSRLALEAYRIGFSGIGAIQSSKNYKKDFFNDFKEINPDFKIFTGVEIHAQNNKDLKNKLNKFRDAEDILIVNGGNLKINRAACEDSRVDILAHPYKNRRDSGINHVLARKAAENEVAIELSINSIIKTRSSLRAKLLSYFHQIIKMQRKFRFPILISSNAHSLYHLRTPNDIITLAQCFGMSEEEAINSLSESPCKIIHKTRLRNDMIVKGARIIRNRD
ncbi:MAG: ribonuclease P protein component 3 [Methanobacterium sp.]